MHRVPAKSPAGPSSPFRQAAPYQGRLKPTKIGLAAPRRGLYRLVMRQLLRHQGLGCGVGRRNVPAVAVVDDDEGFRDALERFLRTSGLHVEAFASGEEFLRWNRMDSVGCVILDLAMPEMSGLEVQEQLTAQDLQIPIVFVTAHGDERLRQPSAAGALAVLRKPVNHDELVRLVREALGG